jgi:hypothetical protein
MIKHYGRNIRGWLRFHFHWMCKCSSDYQIAYVCSCITLHEYRKTH